MGSPVLIMLNTEVTFLCVVFTKHIHQLGTALR